MVLYSAKMSVRLPKKSRRTARTLDSTTAVEKVVEKTVMVDGVAMDKKQLQALLMRESLDEHSDTIVPTGSAAERVAARF